MNKFTARPAIASAEVKNETNKIEAFQNQTLRPIIKQLHPLLLQHFSILLSNRKGEYFKFSEAEKNNYIHSIFQKEFRYKSELKGMIIGNFTIQEFEIYYLNTRAFDKRIFSMLEERILTNQNELQDLTK